QDVFHFHYSRRNLFHVKSGRVVPVTGTFVRSDFYRSWSDCSGHTVSWGSPCDPCCKPPLVIQSAVMRCALGCPVVWCQGARVGGWKRIFSFRSICTTWPLCRVISTAPN